jgi:hypothetical protein
MPPPRICRSVTGPCSPPPDLRSCASETPHKQIKRQVERADRSDELVTLIPRFDPWSEHGSSLKADRMLPDWPQIVVREHPPLSRRGSLSDQDLLLNGDMREYWLSRSG